MEFVRRASPITAMPARRGPERRRIEPRLMKWITIPRHQIHSSRATRSAIFRERRE
jgi:hypothetical protein